MATENRVQPTAQAVAPRFLNPNDEDLRVRGCARRAMGYACELVDGEREHPERHSPRVFFERSYAANDKGGPEEPP